MILEIYCREEKFNKVIFPEGEPKDGVTEKTFKEIGDKLKDIIPGSNITPIFKWVNFEIIPVGYSIRRSGFNPSDAYELITSSGCYITKSSVKISN